MLTARQQEIWGFLVEYVDRHGYPPTVREIGEAVGLASPSTVHAHLANLERAGLLRRDPTKPRALELVGHRRGEAARIEAREPEPQRLPLRLRLACLDPRGLPAPVTDELERAGLLRRDPRVTRPSTLRVYQFRHQRGERHRSRSARGRYASRR